MSIGFAQEKPFPRLWPSLGMIALYLVLQNVIGVAVFYVMDPEILSLVVNQKAVPMDRLAMPTLWTIVLTAVPTILIILFHINRNDGGEKIGLHGRADISLKNVVTLVVVLFVTVTALNWLYETYVVPGQVVQPGIEEMIIAMKSSTLNLCIGLFAVVVLAPVVEELMFRGLFQNALMRKMPPIAAIALAAFVFALIHFQPLAIAPLFLLGFAFGYLYWKTGSLKTNIGLHMLNNAAATALTLYAA